MKFLSRVTAISALLGTLGACDNPGLVTEPGLASSTVSFNAASHANVAKAALCHRTGGGAYVRIDVAAAAVDAHLRHGDKIVGQDVDNACEPLLDVTLVASAPEEMIGDASFGWHAPETGFGRLTCDIDVTFTAEGNVFAKIVEGQFTLYEADGVTVNWASDSEIPWFARDVHPASPEHVIIPYFNDPAREGWIPFVVEQTITYSVGDTDVLKTTSFRTACLYNPEGE